jgi:hypothetical protein
MFFQKHIIVSLNKFYLIVFVFVCLLVLFEGLLHPAVVRLSLNEPFLHLVEDHFFLS